jgi:hypothetical protein
MESAQILKYDRIGLGCLKNNNCITFIFYRFFEDLAPNTESIGIYLFFHELISIF